MEGNLGSNAAGQRPHNKQPVQRCSQQHLASRCSGSSFVRFLRRLRVRRQVGFRLSSTVVRVARVMRGWLVYANAWMPRDVKRVG